VWSTDIAYIRLPRGFVYLAAIIDWYSREVLSWRLSNTMDAGFCVDCLEEAITLYGAPAIFNSDQGSQFTSDAFTGVLLNNGIMISMNGRGRALDNIFDYYEVFSLGAGLSSSGGRPESFGWFIE
jgi:putative transposase